MNRRFLSLMQLTLLVLISNCALSAEEPKIGESQRAQLVEQQIANDSKLAKARAEALSSMMETVRNVDWRTLAATLGTMDAKQTMAMAFQQLAENADKVSNLQITPDLLRTMLEPSKGKG